MKNSPVNWHWNDTSNLESHIMKNFFFCSTFSIYIVSFIEPAKTNHLLKVFLLLTIFNHFKFLIITFWLKYSIMSSWRHNYIVLRLYLYNSYTLVKLCCLVKNTLYNCKYITSYLNIFCLHERDFFKYWEFFSSRYCITIPQFLKFKIYITVRKYLRCNYVR